MVLVWFTPALGAMQYAISEEGFVLHTFQRVMMIILLNI